MNKATTLLLVIAQITFGSYHLQAQEKETFNRDGFTLHFTSKDPSLDPVLKQKLITTFFKVYPLLKNEYNENTAKEVNFVVDTAYKGVAATGGGRVVFSAAWLKNIRKILMW